ncbi:MAG: hypothetical protein GWN58_26375 [Anaerolineae bacterium]|nr:hypothetical protein [Anaerolineae bacterium]
MHKSTHTPWIPYRAIEFLATIVSPDWYVFEWGSGSSTIYWAQRCTWVLSVEDDATWHQRALDRLAVQLCTGYDVKLIPVHPTLYYGPYADVIKGWPDEYFDLVFVDGKARFGCVSNGLAKIKPGGWLLLDNSDMPEYEQAKQHPPATWERCSFYGRGWGFKKPWEATFWRKPDGNVHGSRGLGGPDQV